MMESVSPSLQIEERHKVTAFAVLIVFGLSFAGAIGGGETNILYAANQADAGPYVTNFAMGAGGGSTAVVTTAAVVKYTTYGATVGGVAGAIAGAAVGTA